MDTTITAIGAVVVAELRSAGYMDSTIGQYQKSIKALSGYARERGTSTFTPELGAAFSALTTSARTGRFSAARRQDYRRLVALFDSYVSGGSVDLSTRRRGGGGPRPTSGGFVSLAARWDVEMAERGLAPATREGYGRVARGYLSFLESQGIVELEGADGGTVLAYLSSLLPRWATTSLFWVVSNFRPFLVFTGRADLVDAIKLARITRPHRMVPVVPDHDLRLVVAACASNGVCARDAAITLLALTTGLRACDIIDLRLGQVDWRGRTVSLVQRKTGNPLTVPLTGLLTARLADYVLRERPTTGDDHLFVRQLAPHIRLHDHATVHRVTVEVFRAAGVVQPKAGTQLLRHTAATRMLRAATPLPTISAVLGHASPESTTTYLSVDDERLLRCVLPLPSGVRR